MLLKQQNKDREQYIFMSSYNPTSFTFLKPYHPCFLPLHLHFMWVLLYVPPFRHPSPHDLFLAFWSLQTFQVKYKTNFKTVVHIWERIHGISLFGAGLPHSIEFSPILSMFLQFSYLHFFFNRVEFYSLNEPHFHYSFTSWWRSGLIPFPRYCKEGRKEHTVHDFLL